MTPRTVLAAPRRRARAAAVLLIMVSLAAGCTGSHPASAVVASSREVAALLADHAAAVRHRDRVAFLAGLGRTRASSGYRSRQDAAFDNLIRLPLRTWRYVPGPRVTDDAAQAAARRRYGESALIVSLTLSYSLRGADPVPAVHDLWWTLVREDGHIVIASDEGLADDGGVSWSGPWDFGPIAVAQGRSSLVIGEADESATLRSVAATVDTAVPAVSQVWGERWTRYVAVIVPAGRAALAAALGAQAQDSPVGGDLGTADVAALTVSDGTEPLTGQPREQRLVVLPGAFARLSPAGRRITITHEVAHVAAAWATTDSTPRWLAEGFAEYVANLASGRPVAQAAAELSRAVRAGHLPDALPSDATLRSARTAAVSYEQAWLACRLIAARIGSSGLVRLYRSVGAQGGSGTPPARAVAGSFETVLRERIPTFVARWRAYLSRQLR